MAHVERCRNRKLTTTENRADFPRRGAREAVRGDVEAVDGEDGFGRAEVTLSDVDGDFAFLAGQQGDVVINEENRQNFRAIFALERPETHEKGQARAGAFYRDARGSFAASFGDTHLGVDSGFRKILQGDKIGIFR